MERPRNIWTLYNGVQLGYEQFKRIRKSHQHWGGLFPVSVSDLACNVAQQTHSMLKRNNHNHKRPVHYHSDVKPDCKFNI